MSRAWFACLLLLAVSAPAIPAAPPIAVKFDSTGDDRRAIETLLRHYTQAVSTKDQALFETLLLNKRIPFCGVSSANQALGATGGTEQYEGFRKAVFEGSPFQQRFQNVHIQQDGALANVSLVFVNTSAEGSFWGWKTMQLLKVAGQWKIASEFYTGHN